MPINADKSHLWKTDIQASVELYNAWFLNAAPRAYRDSRLIAAKDVETAFVHTENLRNITPAAIRAEPSILQVLRMATAPPMARDRLTGLSHTPKALLKILEAGRLPNNMNDTALSANLQAMCDVILNLLDVDLFPWLQNHGDVDNRERELATVVVADRLCGAYANPIIRNAQEQRQLALIKSWLIPHGYKYKVHPASRPLTEMEPGTFSLRMNVVTKAANGHQVNIPIDVVIQPKKPPAHNMPILIEAKSAGDFTNTNKRRKEEATKVRQLRTTYGEDISLLLFLCGYFDVGYLGYEAAEGLDWVWEHRIDDLAAAGV